MGKCERFVIATSGREDDSLKSLMQRIERIQSDRALDLFDAFRRTADDRQEMRIACPHIGEALVQRDRLLKIAFRGCPVPSCQVCTIAAAKWASGQVLIKLQRTLGGGLGCSIRFDRRHDVQLCARGVRDAHPCVHEAAVGSTFERSIEELQRHVCIGACEAVEVRPSSKVGIVCRSVDLACGCEPLRLLRKQR